MCATRLFDLIVPDLMANSVLQEMKVKQLFITQVFSASYHYLFLRSRYFFRHPIKITGNNSFNLFLETPSFLIDYKHIPLTSI